MVRGGDIAIPSKREPAAVAYFSRTGTYSLSAASFFIGIENIYTKTPNGGEKKKNREQKTTIGFRKTKIQLFIHHDYGNNLKKNFTAPLLCRYRRPFRACCLCENQIMLIVEF